MIYLLLKERYDEFILNTIVDLFFVNRIWFFFK